MTLHASIAQQCASERQRDLLDQASHTKLALPPCLTPGMKSPRRRLNPVQRLAMPNPTFIKEITVNPIHRTRRISSILAGLAAGLLLLAASPAAFAQVPPSDLGRPTVPAQIPEQIHAIVTGGMPGWQITLIAAGAAALAAVTAVLLDRARTARRTTAPTA